MRFSQRIGKTPVKTILQVDDIDRDLKNCLWNVILEKFFYQFENRTIVQNRIFNHIWKDFFKETIDAPPYGGFKHFFSEWFHKKAAWYEIYDFVEFIVKMLHESGATPKELKNTLNSALEREKSGYRIIGESIAKITDEEELKAIEEAIKDSGKWQPVTIHLKTALDLFTDRKNPDHRNSIKESISAVESCCKIILKNDKATLGEALSAIEKTYGLHGALKSAFSALYGYTSDEGGIRHAITESNIPVDFDDAKFMLVSCSAFTNYLKTKTKLKK